MAKRPTILIVDDTPTIVELYKQRFSEAGFQVETATNGDLGLEKALTVKPDAILLDLMMPVKGGLGALEVLKTMPETKNTPVIVLTAYPADEYKQQSARIGAAHFFSKAETMPGDVVEKVKALIGD